MKKYIILLMTLLLLIIQGCKTTKVEKEIILPPKPQRQELKAPQDLKDIADIINYYEHLVEQWEEWSKSVDAILEEN
ncbi:MAG: hypothetical protein J6S85_09585 [Methanobrevibacter sp.]|nr:hypothetical protein [Methanobrevibacter sp.]